MFQACFNHIYVFMWLNNYFHFAWKVVCWNYCLKVWWNSDEDHIKVCFHVVKKMVWGHVKACLGMCGHVLGIGWNHPNFLTLYIDHMKVCFHIVNELSEYSNFEICFGHVCKSRLTTYFLLVKYLCFPSCKFEW